MRGPPKIIRAGREFWIERDWSSSAEVGMNFQGDRVHVNFSTRGSMPEWQAQLHAKAIAAACRYARQLNKKKGLDREKLMRRWDKELHKFYQKFYYKWHPHKRKKEK